jgi:alpha-glucosidase
MEPMAEWWRGAIVYQIYPLSFLDADGDGAGDLAGATAKLDYVASLGVDAIWLSPFYPSPMKDFGYDVSDYRNVDPIFGSLAQFDALLERARALGLKVIIDQVWSHTSNRHPWFIESAQGRLGPKADWYVWADAEPDGAPPNNWLATFGGPSWSWSSRRSQYYLHNFLPEQPDLNFWNPQVQDAILDVARFWLDRGVDGFRLDVVNCLVHDRDLRDNPPAQNPPAAATPTQRQRHLFDRSRPETLDFVRRLRRLIDSYPDRMMVGEVFDEAALALQQAYTLPPDRLHTAYSFHLLDATAATPRLFAEALEPWTKDAGWPSWSFSNHDVARSATRLAHGEMRLARTLMAALLTMRGSAFIYQGEELGLPDAKVPFDRLRDPFAIAAFAGGAGRDGARTPMPWLAEAPLAGFSAAADAWLPLDPSHRPLAVDRQEQDSESMLAFTRAMIGLRRAHPALRIGSSELLAAPAGVLAFERRHESERLVCVFELAGSEAKFAHAGLARAAPLKLWQSAQLNAGVLKLGPYGGAVLRA